MSDYTLKGPGVEIILTPQEARRLVSMVRASLYSRQRITGLYAVEIELQNKLKDVVVP